MPTTRINRAPMSAPERSDQRRQDVVAIFGTMPPVGRGATKLPAGTPTWMVGD
jgi:hypothetical protein